VRIIAMSLRIVERRSDPARVMDRSRSNLDDVVVGAEGLEPPTFAL
jgi:hypothetical protein